LTIKPKGFYMHVKQRKDRLVSSIAPAASNSRQGQDQSDDEPPVSQGNGKGHKLAIYYGAWALSDTFDASY
jgi:hypothetical protein